MKKAVVTGGLGFIGSHLVERLLQENWQVVAIDNFATGRPSNLEACKGDAKLTVLQADILEPEKIEKAFEGAQWLFHLAALADIVPSIEFPTKYYETNVLGTLRVLELARHAGVKKIMYAASSSCYGIPDIYPTPETAPIRPQYPYALTKYLGEETLLHWGKVYKMDVVSLRLFNVFGPRHRTTGAYGAVFGVFLGQKIHGKPLTIVGDGEQTRDFTYVTDVADAMFCAMQSSAKGEVFNVGSGNTYSVNYLVKLLGGEKVHIPKRPGEPDATFADISKIQKRLGWKPKVSFEEGVSRMLKNIALWKDAPVWTPESIAKATEGWFKFLS